MMSSLLFMPTQIAKAELHVHLDGTLTPNLVRELAKKNQIIIDPAIFSKDGTRFVWQDFSQFHEVFTEAFKVIQTSLDYQLLTYLYLKNLAQQNCWYTELIVSPFHADFNNTPYEQMLTGIINGIEQAHAEYGIEGRILIAFIRQHGPTAAQYYVDQLTQNQHPYVVGVNLVGDIKQYEIKSFEKIYDRARALGLGLSCHAGEIDGGPEEIWQAVDILGASRISHGVRCIEDPKLVAHLREKNIILEVCPTSNIILNMYPSYAAHPLKQLKEQGVPVCINTDDPGFFNTDLSHEYHIAKQYLDFSNHDLFNTTKAALEAAFVDEATKQQLLKKLAASE
jgi:adenosine deaminase